MRKVYYNYADLVRDLQANLHCYYGRKWGVAPILVGLIKRGFVRYPNVHDLINRRAQQREAGISGHLFHAPIFYMFSSRKVN